MWKGEAMKQDDTFDDMLRRLEYAGVDHERASRLAEDCRAACDALRYREGERVQLALTISQAFVSGRLDGDELRSLREQAPFLRVTENPDDLRVVPEYMTAIYHRLQEMTTMKTFFKLMLK